MPAREPISTFEILVDQDFLAEGSDTVVTTIRVRVDGRDLAVYPELVIDFASLLDSLERDGEHAIVTCTCGVPECAGIDDGIHTARSGRQVRWTLDDGTSHVFDADAFDDALAYLRQALAERAAVEPVASWEHVPSGNQQAIARFLRDRRTRVR